MKVHEHQAKDVLRRFGVAVPRGGPATTPAEALEAARALPGPVWVVKAQVHAGGRGKGRFQGEVDEGSLARVLKGEDGVPGRGGVRLARSLEEVGAHAEAMLGRTLVTKQTGARGVVVRRVYVEEGCAIARELYLAVLLDRSRSQVVVMASTEGGTEIEEVAAKHPERIHKVWVDPAVGFAAFQGRQLGFALGLGGGTLSSFQRLVTGLVAAYQATDASLAEVNPLVINEAGDAIALDAKMTFDDSGLFRHPEIAAQRDPSEEDPNEVEASKHDLNYVKLTGEIGCMVNGAGLAMATMDIIKIHGGEPANFLDVGGGATKERVAAGFRIITSDPSVRGILVNIFGGIVKCDVLAEGVLAAVSEVGLAVPLVVRLEGTNVERGRALIAESGLPVITADSMEDAARKVVAAARAGR